MQLTKETRKALNSLSFSSLFSQQTSYHPTEDPWKVKILIVTPCGVKKYFLIDDRLDRKHLSDSVDAVLENLRPETICIQEK